MFFSLSFLPILQSIPRLPDQRSGNFLLLKKPLTHIVAFCHLLTDKNRNYEQDHPSLPFKRDIPSLWSHFIDFDLCAPDGKDPSPDGSDGEQRGEFHRRFQVDRVSDAVAAGLYDPDRSFDRHPDRRGPSFQR